MASSECSEKPHPQITQIIFNRAQPTNPLNPPNPRTKEPFERSEKKKSVKSAQSDDKKIFEPREKKHPFNPH